MGYAAVKIKLYTNLGASVNEYLYSENDLMIIINKIDRGRTISDGPHIQNRNIINRKYKTHFGLRGFFDLKLLKET